MLSRIPPGLEKTPRLRIVVGIMIVAALVVTGIGRCNRALQPRKPPITDQAAPLTELVEVGAVSVGSLVQGTLEVGQRQAWTLAATKGQRIAASVQSAWDNSVSVVMPDSIRVLTQDGYSGGNGQGLITGVTLPADGIYRIVVSGEQGGAGNYELTVTEAPPARPGTITTVGPSDAPILITR